MRRLMRGVPGGVRGCMLEKTMVLDGPREETVQDYYTYI